MRLRPYLALAAAISVLASVPADAQKKPDRQLRGEITLPKTETPPTVSQSTNAIELAIEAPKPVPRRVDTQSFLADASDLRDTATVTHRGEVLGALQFFDLKFQNGDHKIRSLGLMNNGPSITTTFKDNDGDDPYTVSAGFISIDSFLKQPRFQSVTAERCEVQCTIRIDGMGKDETALLAGFEFNRIAQDDNVRALSVEVLPDRSVVNVVFFDDRGPNFAGFMPVPIYDAVRIVDGVKEHKRSFNVKVQVLIVPKKIVQGVTRIMGASQESTDLPEDSALLDYLDDYPRHYALMGFGLSFKNSDHFIGQLAVNPLETPPVKFQDGDTDDPIAWFYDLAVFEPVVDVP